MTTPNPAQSIVHAHMRKVFDQHRHKYDRHRAKGGAFAKALDDLEEKLFGGNASDHAPLVGQGADENLAHQDVVDPL